MASLMASLTATAFLAATATAQTPAQPQIPTVTLAAGPATAAPGWIDYKPEGGRFRVDIPTLPKIAIVQVPIGNGNTVPMTEATSIVRQVAYVASYTDYPNTVTKGAAAEVILNMVRNGAGTGATIRDEKKLQLGRAEGREYTVVQGNGNVAITRTYWSRGRLFQLVVEGKAGIETQAATRHFLESFALVP
jgi:hypothetical protein